MIELLDFKVITTRVVKVEVNHHEREARGDRCKKGDLGPTLEGGVKIDREGFEKLEDFRGDDRSHPPCFGVDVGIEGTELRGARGVTAIKVLNLKGVKVGLLKKVYVTLFQQRTGVMSLVVLREPGTLTLGTERPGVPRVNLDTGR